MHPALSPAPRGQFPLCRPLCATLAMLFLAATPLLTSCNKGASAPAAAAKGPRPVPVQATTVARHEVPVEIVTFGTVKAAASVALKGQVSEVLKQVHFSKGQKVKKGELLFSIETKPFDVALQQSLALQQQAKALQQQARASQEQGRAALERDRVTATHAQQDADRVAELLTKKIASQEDFDTVEATAKSLQQTLKADQAAISNADAQLANADAQLANAEAATANAKLQIAYCHILAPIDGRVGDVMVDAGNLVKANDVPLALINQMSPIQVFFSVPQHQLADIRQYQNAAGPLPVRVEVPGDTGAPVLGKLTFLDNAVDPNTGAITLGATFDNADEHLWPGQYVHVTLLLHSVTDALVLPLAAVQAGQTGKYVFVVKDDQHVERRTVSTGLSSGSVVVIEQGVKEGELVVTDGQLSLTNGTLVELKKDSARTKDAAAVPPASTAPVSGAPSPAPAASTKAVPRP